MLFPTTDIGVIEHRLDHIEICVLLAQLQDHKSLLDALGNITDVRRLLETMHNFSERKQDWIQLNNTITAFKNIHDICKMYVNKYYRDNKTEYKASIEQAKLINMLSQYDNMNAVRNIELCINNTLDIHDTKDKKNRNVVIKYGINERLDTCREALNNLDVTLRNLTDTDIKRGLFPPEWTSVEYTFVVAAGYMVKVSMYETNTTPQTDVQSYLGRYNLSFRCNTKEHRLFKNPRCYELDTELGDLQAIIHSIEQDELRNIRDVVLSHSNIIYEYSSMCYELDALCALGSVAYEMKYVRPTILQPNEQVNIIDIQQGVHPLYRDLIESSTRSAFVPNNTLIGHNNDKTGGRIHIITGYVSVVCLYIGLKTIHCTNIVSKLCKQLLVLHRPNNSGKVCTVV